MAKSRHAACVELPAGHCVEVYQLGGGNDGGLLGYAILFAGYWDAWARDGRGMARIGSQSYRTKEDAIQAVYDAT